MWGVLLIILFLIPIYVALRGISDLLVAILDELRKGKDKHGNLLTEESRAPLLPDRLEPRKPPRGSSEF